jgi:D-sedoheptulose 7-phosphate isomerase
MDSEIRQVLKETARLHEAVAGQAGTIERMARAMIAALRAGRSVYVMGNGGSAADAQHMAGELVGRFLMERRPLPCVALCTDTSVMTAIANDYGVEEVFRKQVQALARAGDVVIGISTSGNSRNVNLALEEARRLGATPLGLAGRGGGAMTTLCDVCLVVPSDHAPRIQEVHGTVIHILCLLVEREVCRA